MRVPINSQTSGVGAAGAPLAAGHWNADDSGLSGGFVRRTPTAAAAAVRTRRSIAKVSLLLPPAAEHRDRVKDASVIGAALAMLLEQPFDLNRVEVACARCPGRIPRLEREVAEAADEPVRQRHLEAELAALERLGRKPWLDRFAQDIFADPATKLELGRHRQRPLDEIMRQERDAG